MPSSREFNKQFIEGKHIDDYDDTNNTAPKLGGPGSQWRMMKLRRIYEAAEEEGRDVEEIALERYGSMEAFNEARMERQYIDDQEKSRVGRKGIKVSDKPQSASSSVQSSRASSRQSSFRKPGEESTPSTPSASNNAPIASSLRREVSQVGSSKSSTPIPSVFDPTAQQNNRHVTQSLQSAINKSQTDLMNSSPALSVAALNKLSAKVMRAEMMGSANASDLRAEYEREKAKADAGGDLGFSKMATHRAGEDGKTSSTTQVQVLPTLDGRGRLYDVGTSKDVGQEPIISKSAKRKMDNFETRDGKTGKIVRYNADDDEKTLEDLVREERFSAGSANQKNMDAQMADRIMTDKSFKNNVDYMDDNVEKLGRKKMKSDAMKRMFAIQDFAKTKKALDTCAFCWQDDRQPRATVISSGTRAFLTMPEGEPLVARHCYIVPMQHHLSMLEADDDTWEEVKNFMKCLIQMEDKNGNGVLFYETVKSLRHQKHTLIEAVPIEKGLFSQMPGYFRQSIIEQSDDWSQNKGLIQFSKEKPFRNSMVPDLPYFMVQWDHRGEKGYGHVIEEASGKEKGRDDYGDSDLTQDGLSGEKAEFPQWFAGEIIGTLLDYEPKRWRRPRKLQSDESQNLLKTFRSQWIPYDWTRMLDERIEK
jgi:Protein similar to CwfJ C-terminus 2/Protein similar to CwfJ C-terminus 1